MKYKQNREKSIILVIGYTVQRKHFLPIYIYIFLNKPVVSFSFPPSLPPPRAACSNVSWIGNGLHLCLAAPSKWDIPVERNIYAPRASYFASMYGNKTSNGNETFFFHQEFHASSILRPLCTKLRTACPFAEREQVYCLKQPYSTEVVFAFAICFNNFLGNSFNFDVWKICYGSLTFFLLFVFSLFLFLLLKLWEIIIVWRRMRDNVIINFKLTRHWN